MTTPEISPETCAKCVAADAAGGFASGAVWGSVLHFVKGFRNSPRGGRLAGSFHAIRMNVPGIAAKWGVWGGVLSACGCTMVYLLSTRDREGVSPSPAPPSSLPTPSRSLPDPPQVSEPGAQSSSWFGGLFGKKGQ